MQNSSYAHYLPELHNTIENSYHISIRKNLHITTAYTIIINKIFFKKGEYAMRKECRSYIFIVFIVLLSVSILAGCAKPPTQEVEKAEQAIADAKQKEADLYARDEFRKAEETLKKAKELIAVKKYKEAKAAAEESANSALMAVSLVEMNKAAMKEEAEKMVPEIQQSLDEIKSLAAVAIKKKAAINKEEIQGAIGKFELDMVSVKDQLQGQKIRGAYDQLIALKEQLKGQKEGLATVFEKKQEAKK
jgi:hypothetical protein